MECKIYLLNRKKIINQIFFWKKKRKAIYSFHFFSLYVHYVCCCCCISIFSTVMSGFIAVASCIASANALSWSIGSPSLCMVIFCSTRVSTTPSFSVLYLIFYKDKNKTKKNKKNANVNHYSLTNDSYFTYCYSFNSTCFARNGLCRDNLSSERIRLVVCCYVYIVFLFSSVRASCHVFGFELVLKNNLIIQLFGHTYLYFFHIINWIFTNKINISFIQIPENCYYNILLGLQRQSVCQNHLS